MIHHVPSNEADFVRLTAGIGLRSTYIPPVSTTPPGGQIKSLRKCNQGMQGFRLSKELSIPCTFCHVQVQLYSILEKQWFVRPVRCFDFERQRGSDAEEKRLILITVLLSTVLSTGVIHIHWIPSETLTEILTSPHYMTLQPRRSQSLWIVKSSSWLRS